MNTDRIWTLLSRKLSGEATQAELAELNDLLKNHPDTAIPVEYMHEFWSIPTEKDEEFLEATFHLHSDRLKAKGFDLEIDKYETGTLNLDTEVRKKRKYLVFAGALCLIAVVLFFSFFYEQNKAGGIVADNKIPHSEVSTKNGSRSKIQLPDGSSVWLNSGSRLTYNNDNFGSTIREVSLTGEAFFDVVKDPSKPFVIHTGKMDIRVLGTAFNVKCYAGDKHTETSLIRGSIEVTLKDRKDKIILKPNEKLVITDSDKTKDKPELAAKGNKVAAEPIIVLGHLTHQPLTNEIIETSWINNRLTFEDELFEDVAVKMERWYNVKITINNDKIKSYRLTGAFENETVEEALKSMQYLVAFNYVIKGKEIIINKK